MPTELALETRVSFPALPSLLYAYILMSIMDVELVSLCDDERRQAQSLTRLVLAWLVQFHEGLSIL
jgi:hypothetical protein